MSKEGRTYRGYWKRLIAAALCASITVTTVFPDNGVAFAASLEDAVATEETRAANEYAEATEEKSLNSKTILVCWSFIRKQFTMRRMANGKTLITL